MGDMEVSWERYLWRHNLLALDPLAEHAGSLRLLDILVKNGNEGWSRRPTIHKVGSLCACRSDEDMHPDWATTKLRIKTNLQELESLNSSTSDMFRKEEQLQVYECNSSSGCGILASILSVFQAQTKASSYGMITVQDVVSEMVQVDWLNELVFPWRIKTPPKWKPDISRIKLISRGADDPENIDLWIVTEIKYGKKIVLNNRDNWATSAVVDSTAMTGIPASAGVTVSSTSNGGLVASGSSHIIPFAFKAIRLVYSKEGAIMKREKREKNMMIGNRRIRVLLAQRFPEQLLADSDPFYHMGGLFFRASEVEGDSSKDVYVHGEDLDPLRLVAPGSEC